MRKVRVIYTGDDELHHCVIGMIVDDCPKSITIEYTIPDSILGSTGLETIKKSNVIDISYRD